MNSDPFSQIPLVSGLEQIHQAIVMNEINVIERSPHWVLNSQFYHLVEWVDLDTSQ